ncbi:MAG: hypothetical protein WCS58_04215, partial [Candidatus Cloacimonadaceae bacterium]|nr:hypothetical protein [Candidatus Cloacimonadota bacterium]
LPLKRSWMLLRAKLAPESCTNQVLIKAILYGMASLIPGKKGIYRSNQTFLHLVRQHTLTWPPSESLNIAISAPHISHFSSVLQSAEQ